MSKEDEDFTAFALIAGIGAVYGGVKLFGALKRGSAKRRAEREAAEEHNARVEEYNAWTEQLEQAESEGKDVCWKCRCIDPKRCSRCDACMNHFSNEEYYPGLCYSCDSGD